MRGPSSGPWPTRECVWAIAAILSGVAFRVLRFARRPGLRRVRLRSPVTSRSECFASRCGSSGRLAVPIGETLSFTLKQAAVAGAGVAFFGIPPVGSTQVVRVGAMPTAHATAVMKRFGQRSPIFQARWGGPELASTISNAGAMGAIALVQERDPRVRVLLRRLVWRYPPDAAQWDGGALGGGGLSRSGTRPGEGDIVATRPNGTHVLRSQITSHNAAMMGRSRIR